MGSWEDKLVEDLKNAAAEDAAARGRAAEDPLVKAYREMVERFEGAIALVKERAGVPVQSVGDAERHRWTSGLSQLTVRIDRPAAKLFVSANLDRDIVMEEVTASAGQLLDVRLRPTSVEELAQRFVTLLFRGA